MRLIDADHLKTALRPFSYEMPEALGNTTYEDVWFSEERIIDHEPTIEAVPVVRCKDCKHYEEWEKGGDCYCTRFSDDPYEYLPMEVDDFCSKGERRDE